MRGGKGLNSRPACWEPSSLDLQIFNVSPRGQSAMESLSFAARVSQLLQTTVLFRLSFSSRHGRTTVFLLA